MDKSCEKMYLSHMLMYDVASMEENGILIRPQKILKYPNIVSILLCWSDKLLLYY